MIVSIVVKNTTKLSPKDWDEFVQEVQDCIGDHSCRPISTRSEVDQVTWSAEFLDVGEDIAIAKAALREIASQPGGEYAWLGVTEAAEVS